MALTFDRGYVDEPFASLVADCPGADVYPPAAFPHRMGPDLPPRPARWHGQGRRHRPGSRSPRDVRSQDPRRRSRPAAAGIPRPARDHAQLRAGEHVRLQRLRPVRRRAPPQRPRHRRVPQPLARCAAGRVPRSASSSRWAASPRRRSRRGGPPRRGAASTVTFRKIFHPTFPEGASRGGTITRAEAMAQMLTDWNQALDELRPAIDDAGRGPAGGPLRRRPGSGRPGPDLGGGPPGRPAGMDAVARRVGHAQGRHDGGEAGHARRAGADPPAPLELSAPSKQAGARVVRARRLRR